MSQTFSTTGFSNWKKALEKQAGFSQHAESKAHISAEQAYKTFMTKKPVDLILSEEKGRQLSQKQAAVKANRNVISRIFATVRFLAKLGLPFRGHNEEPSSVNRGIFLELLSFLAESGDTVLAGHLKCAAGNAKYTSPTIQNEMISLIGSSIQEVVILKVQKAKLFSVLMDETTDLSHREQVSLLIRYVQENDNGSVDIEERMLALVETHDVTGLGLTNLLLDTLKKHNLDIANVVGQGYDGGSNMMGASKGVQARISEINPAALFTHCFCHSLNRAIINSVCNRDNKLARNFFGTVELLYSFVEGSALRHAYFIECQEKIAGTRKHLKGLSDTRWNCRAASLLRLQDSGILKAALETIEHVSDNTSDGNTRGMATGLLESVQKFEFLVCLYALTPALGVINEVSEHLQKADIDLVHANALVSALRSEIRELRNDDKWQEALAHATKMGDIMGIDTGLTEERKRKVPKRLDYSDRSKDSSATIPVGPGERLKIELYFNTLDRIEAQLTQRFPSALIDFAYLHPDHMQTGDGETHIRRLAERYHMFNITADRAVDQWRLSRHLLKSSAMRCSLLEAYMKIPSGFTDIRTLFRIAMTLPVTTAGVERSFSKLCYLKSKLRSTMSQDRLEALMLSAVEKNILMDLSVDDLVAKFAGSCDRRLDLH